MPRTLPTSDGTAAAAFDDCLTAQLDLCQRLEDMAEQLPSKVDTRAATARAKRLQSTLRRCHLLEEAVIFPALLTSRPDLHEILDRLRREHILPLFQQAAKV